MEGTMVTVPAYITIKKHNKNRSIYESLSDLSDEQLIKIIGKKYESIIHKKIIEVGLEEISGLLSGVFNFSGSGLGVKFNVSKGKNSRGESCVGVGMWVIVDGVTKDEEDDKYVVGFEDRIEVSNIVKLYLKNFLGLQLYGKASSMKSVYRNIIRLKTITETMFNFGFDNYNNNVIKIPVDSAGVFNVNIAEDIILTTIDTIKYLKNIKNEEVKLIEDGIKKHGYGYCVNYIIERGKIYNGIRYILYDENLNYNGLEDGKCHYLNIIPDEENYYLSVNSIYFHRNIIPSESGYDPDEIYFKVYAFNKKTYKRVSAEEKERDIINKMRGKG